MIATAGVSILMTSFWGNEVMEIETIKLTAVVIFGISLVLLRKTKLDPVVVMLFAGVLNVIATLVSGNI